MVDFLKKQFKNNYLDNMVYNVGIYVLSKEIGIHRRKLESKIEENSLTDSELEVILNYFSNKII